MILYILAPFFDHLSHYKGTYALFQQDSASARTVNNSVYCLENACGDRIIVRGLCPQHLPDVDASGAC